jgi:hypothetical protein
MVGSLSQEGNPHSLHLAAGRLTCGLAGITLPKRAMRSSQRLQGPGPGKKPLRALPLPFAGLAGRHGQILESATSLSVFWENSADLSITILQLIFKTRKEVKKTVYVKNAS